MYRPGFTDAALADVKSLPKNIKNVIKKEIRERLSKDPYGCSASLEEPLQEWRSFHCRNYRIVFRVLDDLKVLAIAAIGPRLPQSRADIYRRLESLAKEGRLAERVLATLRGFS